MRRAEEPGGRCRLADIENMDLLKFLPGTVTAPRLPSPSYTTTGAAVVGQPLAVHRSNIAVPQPLHEAGSWPGSRWQGLCHRPRRPEQGEQGSCMSWSRAISFSFFFHLKIVADRATCPSTVDCAGCPDRSRQPHRQRDRVRTTGLSRGFRQLAASANPCTSSCEYPL